MYLDMQGGGGIPSLCRYVFFVNEFNLNILNCQVAVLFTEKRDPWIFATLYIAYSDTQNKVLYTTVVQNYTGCPKKISSLG